MTAVLEPGPYWVLRDGAWQIGRWNGRRFWLWGCPDPFLPGDFLKIDPRPIERPAQLHAGAAFHPSSE